MRTTTFDRIFYLVNYTLLILVALSCALPLLHIVSMSLSSAQAVVSGQVSLWPIGLSLESYRLFFNGSKVVEAFGNSVIITVFGVCFSLIFTITTAYPLTKRYFLGRRALTMAAVFTMMFSGGMIPTYLVIKSLGLINSYWALWLPGLISTYNMLVLKSFFENLPEEIEEAARIDGCGEWRMLGRIYLPLSKPVLATLGLFYGVGFWNQFMSVLIYINQTDKYNLTVLVQQMIQSQSLLQETLSLQATDLVQITPEGIKAAGIMVMIMPMLLLYPFLQKYFVKGVMLGSVKG
jgi:putative aldouronate transport system permease protein